MNVRLEVNSSLDKDTIIIECNEITSDVEQIRNYILSKENFLVGKLDDRIHKLSPADIYYFESVDERVFACTKSAVYEIKSRLFELESMLADSGFLRCSKSMLLNIYLTESFSPALNGRFYAHLKNGEKLIVSRKYVPDFKRMLLGAKKGRNE